MDKYQYMSLGIFWLHYIYLFCAICYFILINTQGNKSSQLLLTSLPFLVVMATLSGVGSGDKVPITHFILCDECPLALTV